MRLRIVQAQRQTFDVASWTTDLQFDQIGTAVPDFPDDGCAVIFDPGGGTSERVHQAFHVGLPTTNLEVEVVLPILFCELRAGSWRGSKPCEPRHRQQSGNHAEQEETL